MKLPIIAILFFFPLLGCSLLGIYVIDDPLSAHQRNELGFIYENQGKLDLAEKEYRLAAKRDKNWAVPHFNLGNVYFKKGDHQRAKSHYRQALERDPENPDFMNNLAYVFYKQGDYGEAEKWINRALSIRVEEEYLDTKEKILSAKGAGTVKLP
jgi:tetratricopeptide (TPR) repeat protein